MVNLCTFVQPKRFLTTLAAAALLAVFTISPAQAWPNPTEADKLHVVLLVAGADSNIGSADLKDVAAMRRALSTAFAGDTHRVVFHDLTKKNPKTGRHYTGPEILSHVAGMKVGANDNILIFHSGHGGIQDRNRPEATHMLTVDGGSVNRLELTRAAQKHKSRAVIVLTDCCSSFMGEPEPEAEPYALVPSKLNVQSVRHLMLRPTGLVSITAAEDGTEAQAASKGGNPCQAGSAFTVAMTRLWYQDNVTYTTWQQFFPKLRTETSAASGGAHRARAFHLGQAHAGAPLAGERMELIEE